jgi:hypothetical protein
MNVQLRPPFGAEPFTTTLERGTETKVSYNLCRHRLASDLYCAVPQDRPVPTFIKAANWTFSGATDALAKPPFDMAVARTAVRFMGSYLFVAFDRDTAPSAASLSARGGEPSPRRADEIVRAMHAAQASHSPQERSQR